MNVTNLRYIKDCEENLDMKELIEMHTDDKNLQNDDKLSIRKNFKLSIKIFLVAIIRIV